MMRKLSLLDLSLALAACGTTEGGGAGELTDRTKGYPSGPYGVKEGQFVANHQFVDIDGNPFSMADIFENEQNRLLLLATTAGWCTACREEQPKLAELHQKYREKGLVVMAAMFEDAGFRAADLEDVRDWQAQYKLPYPLLLDAQNQLAAYYAGDPPMNLFVDVDTMKIVKVLVAYDQMAVDAVLQENLDL